MNYGFKLGIGGVVTFKNGGLDKFLAEIPLEHIVLETDAPYLAPVHYRGKRNESSYLINILEGDQFNSGFVEINPNSKIPALLDRSTTPPTRIFESGAILVYLAEKFDAFLPTEASARAECMSWLFWQMGSGPILGGGFGHFYAYAPEKYQYPIDRYTMEIKRQLDVLDRRLADNQCLAGGQYTIADEFEHLAAMVEDDAGGAIEIGVQRVEIVFHRQRLGERRRPAQIALPDHALDPQRIEGPRLH